MKLITIQIITILTSFTNTLYLLDGIYRLLWEQTDGYVCRQLSTRNTQYDCLGSGYWSGYPIDKDDDGETKKNKQQHEAICRLQHSSVIGQGQVLTNTQQGWEQCRYDNNNFFLYNIDKLKLCEKYIVKCICITIIECTLYWWQQWTFLFQVETKTVYQIQTI